VEELNGNLAVGPHLKVWTRGKKKKSCKDGAPERLRCEAIQKEESQILQRLSAGAARRILLFYPT